MNSSPKPDKPIAAVTYDVPGITKISIYSFIHSFIIIFPGSDRAGVPASDIKDIILPSFKYGGGLSPNHIKAKPVDEDFIYSSNTNIEWLNQEALVSVC